MTRDEQLGIRAMEIAQVPPITVNWAGSETVSVEDSCAYLGELAGVEPVFEYSADAHTPLWPDGFRRMVRARHPELLEPDER